MADTIDAITAVSVDSSAQVAPTIPQQASTALPTDTVALSDTARATLLQEKGDTLDAIANALGLSVAEVEADLGLTPPPEAATLNTSGVDTEHPVTSSDDRSVASVYSHY